MAPAAAAAAKVAWRMVGVETAGWESMTFFFYECVFETNKKKQKLDLSPVPKAPRAAGHHQCILLLVVV
jgi:hypothetical protein